jgi:hypothetical protein
MTTTTINDSSNITSLGRYTISIILSYLQEKGATKLLICRKLWTKHLLPIFRLPPPPTTTNNDDDEEEEDAGQRRHHYCFIVYPTPDPSTRLDRLNTVRYYQKLKILLQQQQRQQQQHKDLTIQQIAVQEWKRTVVTDDNSNDDESTRDIITLPPLLQSWSSTLEKSLLKDSTIRAPLFQSGATILASYPRSGNTYVRTVLESVTGFVTNSDTRSDRPLSMELSTKYGLVGEGVCKPPICKTHWPERIGCQPYMASRVILLVRNPWDAIDSYWHLNLTNTHTEKVIDEVYNIHYDFFVKLVRNELVVWYEFLNFYWNQHDVPVLLVRYEDLMENPSVELQRMLSFYTTSNWWKQRFDAIMNDNPHKTTTSSSSDTNPKHHQFGYQPSTSTVSTTESSSSSSPTTTTTKLSSSSASKVGRSLRHKRRYYTKELIEELHQLMDILDEYGWLERLGYHVVRQGFPNNINNLPSLPSHTSIDTATTTETNTTATTTALLPINQPPSKGLRPPNSPFGRNMRQWRRQYTNDDTNPFPTTR